MKVVLAKNDKLLTYMLPNKVTGNIWLSEIDENGIEKKGNNFYIISFYSGIIFLLETVITGLTSFAVLTVAF